MWRDSGDARANRKPDLQAYAAARGLQWTDRTPVHGIFCVDTFNEDFFNLSHGPLPGGETGALCHEKVVARRGTADSGTTHAANTRIAACVPEAIGALRRMKLARISKAQSRYLRPAGDEFRPLSEPLALGLSAPGDWTIALAAGADLAVAAQLFGGDFGRRLAAVPGDFALEFEYGSLVLISGESYAEGDALDALCQHLCGLAAALRDVTRAAAQPQPFESSLPRPIWEHMVPPATKVKKFLGIRFEIESKKLLACDRVGGLGEILLEPWRSTVLTLADELRGELEDPLAFHRAFPELPVPGRAYGVIRLVEDGRTRRIALHSEGYSVGGAAAVIDQAGDSAAPTPMAITTDPQAICTAVAGGLTARWAYREAQVSADEIAFLRG